MDSTTLLQVNAVEKEFATVKAVNRLSFEVNQGEVFALLGPNGAGKTTMIRMILGIIRPDSGDIHFKWAASKVTSGFRGQVGYLPEERGLYKEIPIVRTLTYLGTLRGMRRKAAAAAATAWIERFGLKDRATDKLETLSKGNQQKVQFIAAILHQPSLVILDEPFSGLDPINQELFSTIIRELSRDGSTILLSAHQMQLVERLAHRVLLMSRGREVLSGTMEQIGQTARWTNKLVLRTGSNPDLSFLKADPAIDGVNQSSDGTVTLFVKKGASLSKLLVMLGSSLDIVDIQCERISLHDIYLQNVGADGSSEEMKVDT
ncbi:MAG TPA: ATP-binding cassette domain-containing protein [Blastocatellia bacterium]|nr:ATP-binding cassette domain-containing protein [Blastocatellia bacterium]